MSVSAGRPRCRPIRSRTSPPPGQSPVVHRPLDRERASSAGGRSLEHREDVVPARGHLVPARAADRGPHQPADVASSGGVTVAEAAEQLGRALDVGQQEGDVAGGQLALRLQLRADEADRHDPVLLGRPSSRLRARSRAASSSNATWPNRASALRTCEASWIGSRRRPCESM